MVGPKISSIFRMPSKTQIGHVWDSLVCSGNAVLLASFCDLKRVYFYRIMRSETFIYWFVFVEK